MEGETVERDAAEAFVEKWMPRLGRRQAKEWGADFLAAAEVAFNEGEAEAVARLSADRERLAVLALEAVDELEGWVRSELEGTSYFRENMDAIEARRKAIADLRGEGQ